MTTVDESQQALKAHDPIELLFTAVSAYAHYACDIEAIDFETTELFTESTKSYVWLTLKHDSSFSFELKNTGLVSMTFSIELESIKVSPFRLWPLESIIFPGKSLTVQVKHNEIFPLPHSCYWNKIVELYIISEIYCVLA